MSAVFPGNRPYTLNSLVEELALAERHFRDGSWRECTCNPEKHFPLIAGLASEGYGFAESESEKQFMKELAEKAKQTKEDLKRGISDSEADRLRSWTRQKRLEIEALSAGSCPTCKRLKAKNAYISSGETSNMAKPSKAKMKSVGASYLLNWIGKGVTDGLDPWLDANYPGSVAGYNPSLAVDLLLGIGGPLASLWLFNSKKRETLSTVLMGVGTYVSTHLWNQYQAMPTAGLRYVAYTPRGSVSVAAAVPAQGALGKYT